MTAAKLKELAAREATEKVEMYSGNKPCASFCAEAIRKLKV